MKNLEISNNSIDVSLITRRRGVNSENENPKKRESNLIKFFKKSIVSPFVGLNNDEEFYNNNKNFLERSSTNKQRAIKFNKVVDDMAGYYIQDDLNFFQFFQFLETFFLHMIYLIFGPLSVPILIKFWGSYFIRNLGFWGKKLIRSNIAQTVNWINFVVTTYLSIHIMLNQGDLYYKNQFIFLSPAYIGLVMVIIRYLTVCAKYGFFPPLYYKRYKKDRLTRTEIRSNFLLEGWINPSLLILDCYIKEIFQKYSINIDTFKVQCVGPLSEEMKKSLLEMDNIINEDAKKIRNSFIRRVQKTDKFVETIRNIIQMKKKKKSVVKTRPSLNMKATVTKMIRKSLTANPMINIEMKTFPPGTFSRFRNKNKLKLSSTTHEIVEEDSLRYMSDDGSYTSESISRSRSGSDSKSFSGDEKRKDIEVELSKNRKKSRSIRSKDDHDDDDVEITVAQKMNDNKMEVKVKPIDKLRNLIFNKILPDIREKLKNNENSIENKISIINENLYEIKAVHLCRIIFKDKIKTRLTPYFFIHILIFLILVVTPFIFTNIYYNKLHGVSIEQNHYSNITYAKYINVTKNNTFIFELAHVSVLSAEASPELTPRVVYNSLSIWLLIFSAFVIASPTFLNTVNILYGLIDFLRRMDLMRALQELIEIKFPLKDRKYPLFNIMDHSTMLNWYHLRNIFLNFGKRFSDRIIFQTSLYSIIAIFAIICSILSLFNIFNKFIVMCVGIAFIISIFVNFLIVFIIFCLAAVINNREIYQRDVLNQHKLFLSELFSNNDVCNRNYIGYKDSAIKCLLSNQITSVTTKAKERLKNADELLISGGDAKVLLMKILASSHYEETDFPNIFKKLMRQLYTIRKKIKIDTEVYPIRIIWIRANMALVTKIIAVLSTGLIFILKSVMTTVDVKNILK